MELQDKPLDSQESLQLIQKFISVERHNIRRFAFSLIFLGILIPVAALLQYFLIQFTDFKMPWLSWAILMPAGFISTILYFKSRGKKDKTTSSKGIFLRWLFIWSGVTYFLLAFLCIALNTTPMPFMLVLTSLLIGVSGLVLHYKPMFCGGILFFLTAIACVFITPINQLLLMAIALILG